VRHDVQAFSAAVRNLIADPGLYMRCSAGALNASRNELSLPTMALGLMRAMNAVAALPMRDSTLQRAVPGLLADRQDRLSSDHVPSFTPGMTSD
jgi:hypothetical protein